MPLDRFIKIIITGNARHLVKFGYATKRSLKDTWDSVFSEYMELLKDNSHKHTLNIVREYNVLSGKIEIVQAVVDTLSIIRHDGLINVLRKMGFRYRFTEASMNTDLMAVVAKAKTWAMRVRSLGEEINKRSLEKSDITSNDFDDILIEISAFQGYQIDPKKTTVSEYVSLINRFKKHAEDGKQRKDNRANRRKGI